MDASHEDAPLARAVRDDSESADSANAVRYAHSPARVRWIAVLVLACSTSLLSVAAWLKPDARGYGTHQQLHMAPCGMLVAFGIPCPTCGMTTAFAHTVRGQWIQAAWAQPAGFVFALATALAGVLSIWSLATGRAPRIRFVTPFRVFLTILILLLTGWGLKIGMGLADGSLPVRSMRVS